MLQAYLAFEFTTNYKVSFKIFFSVRWSYAILCSLTQRIFTPRALRS